ncbi:MAG TPA: class IV lanthionine synthetase LanL [Streptosporangiaceae bacterium]
MTIGSGPGRDTADRALLAGIVESVLRMKDGTGWAIRPRGTWCHVLPPDRPRPVQGWKLHVSATPLSAPQVLARCAEVLVSNGSAFKFAISVDQVVRLTSRRASRASGGKFITVYPDAGTGRLRDLAEALHQATRGLPGPGILSDRQYRDGSLVHYRYGAFTGVPVLGNDGMREAMLIAPDGRLVRDHRKAWFCPPSWAPPDPFAQPAAPAPVPASVPAPVPARPASPEPETVLLAGRYAVTGAVRHSFAGGVYRAEDQRTHQPVIIKQARPHTAADLTGGDACSKRRHEADMLRLLAPCGVAAKPVELFGQQGDLFLVLEQIDGVTLREWVSGHPVRTAGPQPGPGPAAAGQIARGLVDLMDLIHQRGLVLRDFNPNNVMVTAGNELRLIDLEMLAPAGVPVPREFTPGYEAPEQRVASVADQAADRYSLGATLFYLATGADPVLPADDPGTRSQASRLRGWLSLLATADPLARWLAPTILQLMDEDPARRPDLPAVRDALAGPPASIGPPAGRRRETGLSGSELTRAISDGTGYLLDAMDPASTARLWPTSDRAADSDPFAVHHGAAGVLATLIRAQRGQPGQRLLECITVAADWIRRRIGSEPRTLPGLHFGHAGTAWTLLEAGQLLHDQRLVSLAGELAHRLPLDCPNQDICHGTAGAGLAQLMFFEATGQSGYLDRANLAAESVASAASYAGGLLMWPVPDDFPSELAGAHHLGFAHGVAGVGAFLLAAGHATGDQRYLSLAVNAAATLAATAERDGEAAYWPASPGGRRRTHWCSGSSGVGTFLLRAWHHTGEQQFRKLAMQAAAAIHRARWQAGPSQCHGLAGDAEFLLDLADTLDPDRYRPWAHDLAGCIYARHAIHGGRMVAPDETGTAIVPGYGTGLAGVLAFLLRLHYGGPRMWLPQALQAAHASDPAASDTSPPTHTAAKPARGGDPHADRHQRPADLAGSRNRR